jgi:hypothetical protein
MMTKPFNWPRLVFAFVPLLIVMVDAVVLVGERLQPDAEKAVRLVKESASRKENFTVQQYLYMTVYHRKASGEPIAIEGWRANLTAGVDAPISVELSYTDASRAYAAMWEVNVGEGSVKPKNEAALDLSWH